MHNAICMLLLTTVASATETTFSPVESTDFSTNPPQFRTLPPKTQSGPCVPAGVLHMDFGGDVASFGDTQQVPAPNPGPRRRSRALAPTRPGIWFGAAGDAFGSAPGSAEARTKRLKDHSPPGRRGGPKLRGARGRGRRPDLAPDQGAAQLQVRRNRCHRTRQRN